MDEPVNSNEDFQWSPDIPPLEIPANEDFQLELYCNPAGEVLLMDVQGRHQFVVVTWVLSTSTRSPQVSHEG